jgi:Uma2 family endonuclease
MSSATGISVEQYLSTSYRPDCDYVDGEMRERNVGEYEHSNPQTGLAVWLRARQREWNIRVLVEQRIRVAPRRYRIPDICVLDRDQPIEPVFTLPPLICIEILSKDDSLRDMQERVTDYLTLGVPSVWILDPLSHRVYTCAQGEFREPVGGVLEATGTVIRIPLDQIFTEPD